jgi:hypothetical protein
MYKDHQSLGVQDPRGSHRYAGAKLGYPTSFRKFPKSYTTNIPGNDGSHSITRFESPTYPISLLLFPLFRIPGHHQSPISPPPSQAMLTSPDPLGRKTDSTPYESHQTLIRSSIPVTEAPFSPEPHYNLDATFDNPRYMFEPGGTLRYDLLPANITRLPDSDEMWTESLSC